MDAPDTHPPLDGPLRKRPPLGAVGTVAQVVVDPDRPAIFDLLFWSILALTYAFRLFAPEVRILGTGLLPMTVVCAVLVVVWLVLPWRPTVSRWRKLAAPIFLLAATATLLASDLVWAAGLFPVAFANAVFLFGTRRGTAYAAVTLFALFATALTRAASVAGGSSPETVVLRFLVIALLSAICLGLSAAVIDARLSRDRAEALLADLAAAHAELGRSTERVRELALAGERARIARDIHDSVGHYLTAVKLHAEAAVKMAEQRPERAREQMARARDLAAVAYEEVRRSVKSLAPPTTGERSGVGALRALVRGFEGTGIDIRFQLRGEERLLPEESERVLYRALQEGLTNAARHSGARRIDVCVSFGESGVRLVVTDDGRGSPPEGGPEGGSGLAALAARVDALGGTIAVGNAPGGGFVVETDLPLAKGVCAPEKRP